MSPVLVAAVTTALAGAFAVAGWRWTAPLSRPVVAPQPRRHRRPHPGRRPLRSLGSASGAALLFGVAGPWLTAALVLALTVVRPRWRRVRETRVAARVVAAGAPDAIDLLVALVRAGLSPRQAVTVLAARAPPSWRPGFMEVEQACSRGARFVDALDELPRALGAPARSVVEALQSSERYGHPLGPLLEQLADDGRSARRRIAEADARTLPVRLSFPLVCCTLPSFVLLTIAPLLAGAFSTLTLPGGHP
jgi:tight adherence protein C